MLVVDISILTTSSNSFFKFKIKTYLFPISGHTSIGNKFDKQKDYKLRVDKS